jgi:hypothetical protein
MTMAADLRPGDVFACDVKGSAFYNALYIVLKTEEKDDMLNVHYLYISGPDAGLTYRTMLKGFNDWGDTRILESAVQ